MAFQRIFVTIEAAEAIEDLQDKVLRYEITPEEATIVMESILSPFIRILPGPYDETEICVQSRVYSFNPKEVH